MMSHTQSQRDSSSSSSSSSSSEEEEDGRLHVAVAIDKDKTSQTTLKWALDNIVTPHHIVKLLHVNHKSIPFPPVGEGDATMELFLPFRCYCSRRQINCEVVVLDDHDICKALVGYVTHCGIETLVLGASKHSLAKPINKFFKVVDDVPGGVLKAAPDFCNVYIISKGKVRGTRSATQPVPFIPEDAREAFSANKLIFEGTTLGGESEKIAFQLFSEEDNYSPHHGNDDPGGAGHLVRTARVNADGAFFAFCDTLRPGRNILQNSEANYSESPCSQPKQAIPCSPREDMSPVVDDSMTTSFSLQKPEEMEDEIKRLKMELKHTMEMYYTACKEALEARRKAKEIQEWKKKEEEKVEATDIANMKLKSMKVKYEASQEHVKQEGKVKKKLVRSSGGPHTDSNVKYKNLYHIVSVLFVFYFYFTIKIIFMRSI